ncbi:hypothetical protein EUA93_12715 [Nocardioides oleivorans]|uniref:Glycosyl hydrolase family 98 putative carbohydrate-binding module domain-containing protein n=1 Tax=Nocardioides oleivorans TaxID=273676 RepID=A0A4Q2S434_9ACTN|nr:hypothetical protein [Nocardioides oleivorans]RYB95129.1 hypothetical protein EUA93_12715 [Nocardioides oleivorans]
MNRTTAWAALAGLAASSLALTAPAQAAPDQPSRKAGTYSVSASVNKTTAIGKETVLKIRGRVSPKAAGEKVILQQRVDGKKKWKATGTTKVKANGTYKVTDDPSTPGTREYRVVKPASNGFGQGVSKTLEVEVYAWQKLLSRQSGPRVNLDPTGVTIGADYYAYSLATVTAGTPSSVEYTLGRKCTDLRTTYALTDASPTGSSGQVVVTADGAVKASHALAVGTIIDGTLDISDVFRLKLDLTTSASPAAIAAVAKPEVLCTR